MNILHQFSVEKPLLTSANRTQINVNIVSATRMDLMSGETQNGYEYDTVFFEESGNSYTDDALEIIAQKIVAQDYLDRTDFKFLTGYAAKQGEDIQAIQAKRDAYREFIRGNA